METSTRKPSWGSIRSRRIGKDPFIAGSALAATPTRAPGQFRTPAANHPVSLEDKDQYVEDSGPLSSPTSRYKATRPDEEARQPRFKGFHNAFIDSGSVMAQSPLRGKEGHIENHRSDPFLAPVANDIQDLGKKGKGREVDEEFQYDSWEQGDIHCRRDSGGENMMVVFEEGVDWGEEVGLLYIWTSWIHPLLCSYGGSSSLTSHLETTH
jgi:hypothetical protein